MNDPTHTFASVPYSVRGHFRLNFYAAVDRLLNHVVELSEWGGDSPHTFMREYPFLAGYAEQIKLHLPKETDNRHALAWWQDEMAVWEAGADRHLPLSSLNETQGFDFLSRLAFMLVGLVEEDSRFGTVMQRIQQPLPYRRPCLETVGRMLTCAVSREDIDAWDICGPLISAGFLEVADCSVPRSEWVLRVPAVVWDGVRGETDSRPTAWCEYTPDEKCPILEELIFPGEFLDQLAQIPSLVSDRKADSIVLRGTLGSDRRAAIAALARALGRSIVSVDASLPPAEFAKEHLGALCTLLHALPVLTCDLGPGETLELPTLNGYRGPVGILMGFEGGLRGPLAESAVSLNVPTSQLPERIRHWQAAFAGRRVEGIQGIAERFHLPGKYIRQAATMAVAHAALDRRESIRGDDVREACRSLNRQLLDTLADRLEVRGSWDWLVVSDLTTSKLSELERRCRQRERLLNHLGPGFGTGANRGVRALLTGASGTGKTMAAKILAAELGMDLYRVDLGAVVNKYIGETEKNLHRVLSTAEELDVILLLDEGDALLGNRTDVKSANDRYANLETNYLLQRLEHYQGIVVVTTNASENIDRAFQRRMDVVVNFVSPQPPQRWHIWQTHLPPDHAVDDEYLGTVATTCALTGGQIRNAALHATLLAVDEDGGIVTRYHVDAAIRSEYRKGGGVCPLNGNADESRDQNDRLESLLGVLRREF